MLKKFNTKSKAELIEDLKKENFRRKTISFYRYVKIKDPQAMRDVLFDKFSELGALGRIYVATEGINAQMNVPEHNFSEFNSFVQSIPEFNGVPYKVALEERGLSSFLKLIIKVRPKIVADGLDDATFDPANTGAYVTAKEANEMIDRGAVVIDMRNFYEAMIGHFEKAKIMEVDTFREQLQKVTNMFKGKKDADVLLYCTGGIRCEKASAWMKHNGFKNVRHIKGGIIDYVHQVKKEGLPNKFKGKNFVFDERLGEKAGDEVISYCQVCDVVKTDEFIHCKNILCHVLFLSCEDCTKKLDGYCSRFCMLEKYVPKNIAKFIWRRDRQKHENQYKKNYKKLKLENAVS